VKHDEPIKRLFTQGMVLKGGTAMSKSKGNVVARTKWPTNLARTRPLYRSSPLLLKDLEWSEESIEGAWRFLNRVFRL